MPEDCDFDINGDEIKKEVKQGDIKQKVDFEPKLHLDKSIADHQYFKSGMSKRSRFTFCKLLSKRNIFVLLSFHFRFILYIFFFCLFSIDDSAEDDNEKEADETELERILKKNEYYKKLKEDREFKAKQLPIPEAKKKKNGKKSQMKKNDDETEDDGFGHKVKLLDIPGTVGYYCSR